MNCNLFCNNFGLLIVRVCVRGGGAKGDQIAQSIQI